MSVGWMIGGLSLLAFFLLGFLALRSSPSPLPSGQYPVGSRVITLEQQGQSDAREARAVSLRVFFPANGPGKKLAPLMDERVGRAFAAANGMPSIGGEEPSGAYADASPIEAQKFPVILFLHGAMSFADQNASTLIDLASHGFVVVALSHPGESILTVYADGSTRPMDEELSGASKEMQKNFAKNADSYVAALRNLTEADEDGEAAKASRELGKIYEQLFGAGVPLRELVAARKAHIERVAVAIGDAAQREAAFGGVAALMDPERIGILGHSLGAYSALGYLEESGKAWPALAFDIPYFSLSEEAPRPLAGPLLGLFAEQTKLPNGAVAKTAGGLRTLLRPGAPADTQIQLEVRGTQHMNFSDMNALPRLLHWLGVLGPIEGERAAQIMNAATRGFFLEHLRGEPGDWLGSLEAGFEEVKRVD